MMIFNSFKYYLLSIFFFLFLLTVPLGSIKTDSNPEPYFGSNRDRNIQDKVPEPIKIAIEKSKETIGQTKENLVNLKDSAYQKMMEASHALSSAREGIREATSSAWDNARDTYEKAKEEVNYYLKTSGETILEDFQKSRNSFVESMKKTGDYINSAKDTISDSYYNQLDNLLLAENEAKKKYDEVYEKMRRYYIDSYYEARKDLLGTEETLAHVQERFQNFMDKTTEKGNEKYEQTKRQLELNRNRAQENYEAAKRTVEESKGKMKDFYDQGMHLCQSYWEATKERAQRATKTMKDFIEDGSNEAKENYETIKNRMTQSSNKAQELSNIAGEFLNGLKQKFEEFQSYATEKIQDRVEHMTSAD